MNHPAAAPTRPDARRPRPAQTRAQAQLVAARLIPAKTRPGMRLGS